MGYSSFPFNIPAGLEINSPLTFSPTAAIVNNYTPFYIYFPDGLNFCPPWTSGAIILLGHATQARASWLQSPFGIQTINIPIGITYSANITFSADPNLSISGGATIQNPFNPAQLATQSFDLVAGTYGFLPATIPNGSIIKGLTLAAVVSGGTIGSIYIEVTDGTTTARLAGLQTTVYGGVIVQDFPDLVLNNLNINAPSWTPHILCSDALGICTYHVAASLIYG